MKQLITTADLSEGLIDYLNGMNAVITALAEKAGLSDEAVKDIQHKASAAGKREQIAAQIQLANMEAFSKDKKAMAAWALDSSYMYANAEEWAKAAEVQWKAIGERNGSKHGKPHDFRYKTYTRDALLATLKEYEGWAKSTDAKYARHRARSLKALPHIKKKLAALLTA